MQRKRAVPKRRLSGLDAAFLYLERKEIPLHVAGVFVFDGPIPYGEFVANLGAKLHAIPKARQVVVIPPFNAGYPTWEEYPPFDIREHVFAERLEAPGGDAELEALCGRILSQVMDRSKPLWDIRLVSGLKGGGGALILRMHHALADGIAARAFIAAILDPSPEGSRKVRRVRPGTPGKTAAPPSLAASIASGIRSSLQNLISAEATIFDFARTLLNDRASLDSVAGLIPELLAAVERLPFNKPCGSERKFCWAELSLPEIQAIRMAVGGSINDVVLTVLTRAVARYVELHGQSVVNRLIRIVCPVNLREDDGQALGNRISFLPVVLPMDIKSPVRMLHEVAKRTAAMKRVRAADLIALAASCIGVTPPAIQAMLWRSISDVMLPFPLLNIICTNLPGFPVPMYCLGRRLTAIYPQVPTGYELGINCAVMSYCDKLGFGLIADAQVAGDVSCLRDLLYGAFDELCVAARVRVRAPRSRPASKAKATSRKRAKAANAERPPVTAAAGDPAPEPVAASAESQPATEVTPEPGPETPAGLPLEAPEPPAPAPRVMMATAGA